MEAGVAVRLEDRRIYRAPSPSGNRAGVWGRRLRMIPVEGEGSLCEVDECLSDESLLQRLEIGRTAP